MDWTGWALFGLVATAALTAVMITAQLAGLTRLDLPLALGTLVTEVNRLVRGGWVRSRRNADRARMSSRCR